jgi:hypothetical protein
LKRLDEIKEKYVLDSVSLDSIGKVIVMVGKSLRLQTAKNNINHFLQSIAKDPENEFGAECCEICCEELNHPYRLQSCGHVFCLECLMISVNNSFADASTFPIKCPNCLEHIVIRDLTNILDETAWGKLRNIAINDYVNKNSENYMFCYTANCQGIHSPKVPHFSCDVCRLSYCAKCKVPVMLPSWRCTRDSHARRPRKAPWPSSKSSWRRRTFASAPTSPVKCSFRGLTAATESPAANASRAYVGSAPGTACPSIRLPRSATSTSLKSMGAIGDTSLIHTYISQTNANSISLHFITS